MERRRRSVCSIARIQHITPQWARRVYRKHRGVAHPRLGRPGRPPTPTSTEDRERVLAARGEYPGAGAVALAKLLPGLSHHRVHAVLKEHGMAKTEPKKSRQRAWVRYERDHANSLWHTDWFELRGQQVIAFIDDASRLAVAVRAFSSATAENAVIALNAAVERYGIPRQLMSDHGTQFTSIPHEGCAEPQPGAFQQRLAQLGIEHIKARVKHPQSNGKVERFVGTVRTLTPHFPCLNELVRYYNLRRPHMSLELEERLRTPLQAFIEKGGKERRLPEEKLISG